MKSSRVFFLALSFTFAMACNNPQNEVAPPPMQVEIMASEISYAAGEYFGHAFMAISLPVSSGVKEDFYGFYPKNGGVAMIDGPGVVNHEAAHNPGRFSRITVSVKKPVTDQQRRDVLKVVNDWNTKNYSLADQNCIDFIVAVAQTLGWTVPVHAATATPEDYVTKLRDAN